MIRAKPHQQQPPEPATCAYCGAEFNNRRRRGNHIRDRRRQEIDYKKKVH